MNNPSRILIIVLLFFGSMHLAGCKTQMETTASNQKQENEQRQTEVSKRRQIESSALLVDGTRQKALGNYQQAALLFFEALKKDPLNDAASFELSKIHAMQGEFEAGLEYAKKAAEIDPANVYYQFVLADLYILTNKMPQAITIYKDIIRDNPEKPEYYFHLVNAYMQNEQYQEAIGVLEQIEALVGFNEEIALRKQNLLIEIGDYEKAISEAEKLLEIYPMEPVFYEVLSDLYVETNQIEKAYSLYNKWLQADPGNPQAFLMMADYYNNEGDTLQAFNYLKKAFSSPELETDIKAQILYSFFMASEQDPNYLDQALDLSGLVVEMHPDDADSYLIHGDFLSQKGELRQARENYLKSIEIDPSNVAVWQQLLFIDNQLEDFEAMKAHSEDALEYFFEQPVLFLFNGLANMLLENYDDAAASFEYGLSITTSDDQIKEEFLMLLGDVYHSLGGYPQSDQYYERALELNPENATVLNNYSYHLAERKIRLDDAKLMSEKALELDQENAAFLDTYGWVLYQMGQYNEALLWLEKSLSTGEASGGVIEHYGDALYKTGQKEKALDFWKQALEAGSDSPLLEKKINDKTLYE